MAREVNSLASWVYLDVLSGLDTEPGDYRSDHLCSTDGERGNAAWSPRLDGLSQVVPEAGSN